MITLVFLNIFVSIARAFLMVLPDSPGLSVDMSTSLSTAFSYLSPFTNIIDPVVVFSVLFSLFATEIGISFVYLTQWTIRKVPGVK